MPESQEAAGLGTWAGLWFTLYWLESYSETLKERWVQAIPLGQALLGLSHGVGSPVCDSLGVRVWQLQQQLSDITSQV